MKANLYGEGRSSDLSQKTKAPVKGGWTAWLVPVGLILLSIIPLAGGVYRLTQMAGGATITPNRAHRIGAMWPM